MSQGQIGYMLSQQIYRTLEQNWKHVPVACLLIRSVVVPDGPALEVPTKPVGPFVDAERARETREADVFVR